MDWTGGHSCKWSFLRRWHLWCVILSEKRGNKILFTLGRNLRSVKQLLPWTSLMVYFKQVSPLLKERKRWRLRPGHMTWLSIKTKALGRYQEVKGEWGNHKGFLKAIKQLESKSASKLLWMLGVLSLLTLVLISLDEDRKHSGWLKWAVPCQSAAANWGGSSSLCLGLLWLLTSCLWGLFLLLEGLPLCLLALWGFFVPSVLSICTPYSGIVLRKTFLCFSAVT